jgi:hypothetical protein
LLNAMTASPSLHEWLHADAAQHSHQCAVTLFAHGKMDLAGVQVAVIATSAPVEKLAVADFSCFAPAIKNLPAGRAPPVSSSNS